MEPISLNISELKKNITAQRSKLTALGIADPELIYHPRPGIFGFIIRNPDFGKFDQAALHEVATGLSVGQGKPVTALDNGGIVIGFLPQNILRL